MPGPPPKRSDQRRRRNKPTVPVDKAPAAPKPKAQMPPADKTWHPLARRWYESLADSGQSAFYEPSDWATAAIVAETMSRELRPQPVLDKDGTLHQLLFPPKGASMAAWFKAMAALMVTEGDRRRLRLELERPKPQGEEKPAGVSWIDDARDRLRQPG